MVVVSSNVDKVIKSFKKFRNAVQLTIDNIAERLAKAMVEDMQAEIEENRSIWLQPNGNLEKVVPISYTITRNDNNTIRVTLGDNLPLIKVGNTKYSLPHNQKTDYVNPLYFIEFGWGVVGENNPKQGTTKYSWVYNTNEHGSETENPFYFWGNDGILVETQGRKGINFMYNTLERYREQWKYLLIYMIKENM